MTTLPPEEPSLPAGAWLKKNLLSNFNNGAMSVASLWLSFWAIRGVLNFIFSEERDWNSVRFNLRLIMTQAYPSEQYVRVWVSVAVVIVLAGLSVGLGARAGHVSLKKLSMGLTGLGGFIALAIIMREPSALVGADGLPVLVEVPESVGGGTGTLGVIAWTLALVGVAARVLYSLAQRWWEIKHAWVEGLTRLISLVAGTGGVLLLTLFVLGPWAFRDDISSPVRESFSEAMSNRGGWWLTAIVFSGAGAAIWFGLGDKKRRNTFVPLAGVGFTVTGLAVLSGWIYPWGSYTFSEDGFLADPGAAVSNTTRVPWTVIWLLLVGTFFLGRVVATKPAAASVRAILNGLWLASPFFLFWVVLRDPDIDYNHVWSTDLPMGLAFAVLGGVILWALTRVDVGEIGRLVAVVLTLVATFNWIAGFAGLYPMLQKARFSFLLLALFALAAPNFASTETRQRMKLVWTWVFTVLIMHYLVTLVNSPSTIETPSESFLGGFSVSIFVAVFTILFSFPLGVLLALARTSEMPIFRVLATLYIEAVRGVPLITVLFFFANIVNLFLPTGMSIGNLAAVTLGFTLFSAAYLAENVRGGLQAVRRGQYEAADALGLTTAQRTTFIVLPQALRVSIPPLVGQLIATFKDTSLLSIIGVFDILFIANRAIPAQSEFLGIKREALLFISIIYWVFAFSMSKYSQSLEKRLGVGER